MAYWLEIHCDVLSTAPNESLIHHTCWSHQNNNPGGFVRSINDLNGEAKSVGWKRRKDGSWICPGCQTMEHKS